MEGYLVLVLDFLCIAAQVKIRKGVFLRQFAVHPCVDPEKDGDDDSGVEAYPEQTPGGGTVCDGSDECHDIHENQQDNADNGNYLL